MVSKAVEETAGRSRLRRFLLGLRLQLLIILATLAAIEVILHLVQPAYLRFDRFDSLRLSADSELGWFPVANSASTRTPGHRLLRYNSLGLRDIEFDPQLNRTILFLGDSLVWGYVVEDAERFTDLLRPQLPGFAIVNAGITGYGTDQEYLLLGRLWERIKPDVVVLVVCVDNDRRDNSQNVRY